MKVVYSVSVLCIFLAGCGPSSQTKPYTPVAAGDTPVIETPETSKSSMAFNKAKEIYGGFIVELTKFNFNFMNDFLSFVSEHKKASLTFAEIQKNSDKKQIFKQKFNEIREAFKKQMYPVRHPYFILHPLIEEAEKQNLSPQEKNELYSWAYHTWYIQSALSLVYQSLAADYEGFSLEKKQVIDFSSTREDILEFEKKKKEVLQRK